MTSVPLKRTKRLVQIIEWLELQSILLPIRPCKGTLFPRCPRTGPESKSGKSRHRGGIPGSHSLASNSCRREPIASLASYEGQAPLKGAAVWTAYHSSARGAGTAGPNQHQRRSSCAPITAFELPHSAPSFEQIDGSASARQTSQVSYGNVRPLPGDLKLCVVLGLRLRCNDGPGLYRVRAPTRKNDFGRLFVCL